MAELHNTSVFSETDANNNSGTVPSWPEGMAPSQVNDSARALQGAVTREWNWRNYTLTSGGSSNAYTLTYSVAPASLGTGQRYAFKTNFANTGSATLNINSLGAKTIKKVVAGVKTNVASGDIVSGQYVEVAYDGTDMVWINYIPPVDLTNYAVKNADNSFSADQTIVSSSGGTTGPTLTLLHSSPSPAANDVAGRILVTGNNSAAAIKTYGQIYTSIIDPNSGSEDSTVNIANLVGGSFNLSATFGAGVYSGGATGGDKGADSTNFKKYYVDGVDYTTTYISSDTVVAAGGAYAFAHGLGVQPRIITFEWICVSAEGGYSVNFNKLAHPGWHSDSYGFESIADSGNINVRIGSSGIGRFFNWSTGAVFSPTTSSWKLRVTARA